MKAPHLLPGPGDLVDLSDDEADGDRAYYMELARDQARDELLRTPAALLNWLEAKVEHDDPVEIPDDFCASDATPMQLVAALLSGCEADSQAARFRILELLKAECEDTITERARAIYDEEYRAECGGLEWVSE